MCIDDSGHIELLGQVADEAVDEYGSLWVKSGIRLVAELFKGSLYSVIISHRDIIAFVCVKLCDLIGIAKSLTHRCAAFTDAKMPLCAIASDAFGLPETDNSELPM